jgi:DNA-directed RNA polymerase I subunit RPA2
LLPPTVPAGVIGVRTLQVWPTECRQRATSYSGRLLIKLDWEIDGIPKEPIERDLGTIPIMVKVVNCLYTIYTNYIINYIMKTLFII